MNDDDCAEFEEQLEELVVGDLAEPARGRALAHAASCRECRGQLDALLALADNLLMLAPQHEPPPGFESRVLERMGVRPGQPNQRPHGRGHVRRWWLEAAAALVLIAVAVGAVALLRRDDGTAGTTVRTGVIVTQAGATAGAVKLIDSDHPYALITIDRPQQRGGEVYCELQLSDGRIVRVGSWGYDDVKSKVWAVGIDSELLHAVTMRIVDDDGAVLATAALH
jgi:hypothetical protein